MPVRQSLIAGFMVIIGRIAWWAVNHDLRVRGLVTSPLLGPAGNREFFLWLQTPRDNDSR